MSVWGVGLGAALGAIYGLIVGITVFPPLGILIGPPGGAFHGAVAGLVLGIVEGATLWAVTALLRERGTLADTNRYRQTAGRACAATCVLTSALFFELTAWGSGTSLVSGPQYDRGDLFLVVTMVAFPTLISAVAYLL